MDTAPFSFKNRIARAKKKRSFVAILSLLLSLGIAVFSTFWVLLYTKDIALIAVWFGNESVLILLLILCTYQLLRNREKQARFLEEEIMSTRMLIEKDQESLKTNEQLAQLNKEFGEVTKILLRRDLELTEANTRLRELDLVKSEFVSVAAHQLRTPLTVIRWTFHALLEKETGKLNSQQRRFLEDGLKSTMHLIDIINDLLTVARIEEGKFGFSFELHSLSATLKETCASYKKIALEKGVNFVVHMPPDSALPPLLLDKEKIAMVFDNLLDNAIRYTLPGGKVFLDISREKEKIKAEVRDTGIGIPKTQIGRLFSKFFRADNALYLQTTGNGLGLYTAKNIIERHGGTISVESTEGKGSTFLVTLPIH